MRAAASHDEQELIFRVRGARGNCLFSEQEIDYKALLDSSMDVILQVTLRAGEVRFNYLSPSVFDVFGWTTDELCERSPEILFTEESRQIIAEDVRKLLSGELETSSVEVEGVHKDGQRLWLENKVKVLSRDGAVVKVAIAMRDISKRKELENTFAQLASLDGLTGLANRRSFDQRFESAWHSALTLSEPLSLIMIDVDHFKHINDSFGHQTGDDTLKAVAIAIASCFTAPDALIARFGGEEIAVILPCTEAGDARALANSVCDKVRTLRIPTKKFGNSEGCITVSCGVATALPRAGGSITCRESLLMTADRALYEAKASGRDRVGTSFLLTLESNEHSRAYRVQSPTL